MSPRPSLSILTSLHAASADGGTNNVIQETCKKCAQGDPTNVSYKFYVASLKSNPNSRCADLRGLGLISVELLRHDVSDTKLLLKSEKMDPFIKACLQDCLELYSDAVPTVNEAIGAYKDEKYEDVNIDLNDGFAVWTVNISLNLSSSYFSYLSSSPFSTECSGSL